MRVVPGVCTCSLRVVPQLTQEVFAAQSFHARVVHVVGRFPSTGEKVVRVHPLALIGTSCLRFTRDGEWFRIGGESFAEPRAFEHRLGKILKRLGK